MLLRKKHAVDDFIHFTVFLMSDAGAVLETPARDFGEIFLPCFRPGSVCFVFDCVDIALPFVISSQPSLARDLPNIVVENDLVGAVK